MLLLFNYEQLFIYASVLLKKYCHEEVNGCYSVIKVITKEIFLEDASVDLLNQKCTSWDNRMYGLRLFKCHYESKIFLYSLHLNSINWVSMSWKLRHYCRCVKDRNIVVFIEQNLKEIGSGVKTMISFEETLRPSYWPKMTRTRTCSKD